MIKKQPGCSWASRQTMRWGPAFEGSHESDVCDVAQPRLRVVAASGSSHWACWVLGSLRPCLCFSFSSGDRWTSSSPSEWPQHKGRKLVCTIASDCKCLLNLIWCHRHQHPEKSVSSFGAQESSHISASNTQLKSRIMRIQMAPMSNFNFGHRTHWTHRSWNPHFGTLHPLVGGLQTPCCRRESLP